MCPRKKTIDLNFIENLVDLRVYSTDAGYTIASELNIASEFNIYFTTIAKKLKKKT